MTEPALPPAPPGPPRTWRPMALWTAGILLALGLAWFVGAVAVPYFRIRAFMAGNGPGREDVSRLGGPERAARWIVWYLRLPKAVAPRGGDALWQLTELRQHAVPCLIQCMKEDSAGARGLAAYLLGQALLGSVQKAEWEEVEPDMEPRTFNDGILALAGAIQDGDEQVRGIAATELGFFGQRAAPAIPVLERLAGDTCGDETVRALAQKLVKQIRAERAP